MSPRSATPDVLGDVYQETNDVVATVMGTSTPGLYYAGTSVMVRLELLFDNPYQPRQTYTGIEELAENIRRNGLLQPPVARSVKGHYELAFGHRRLRAYRHLSGLAGQAGQVWDRMPVIVRQLTDDEMAKHAWSENHNREDVSAVEEARLFARMMNDFGLTQQEIADDIGKSRSAVANTLRLLQLPAEVQTLIDEGKLTERHGRELLRLASVPRWQQAMIANVLAEIKNAGDAPTVSTLTRMINQHIKINGTLMPLVPIKTDDPYRPTIDPPVWGWEYAPRSPDVQGPCQGCGSLVQFAGDPAPRCCDSTCRSAKLRLWTDKERERQNQAAVAAFKALAAAKALPTPPSAPAQTAKAKPASEPTTGADGSEFSRMDSYNLRIFGTDDAPAGLLQHGLCGKGKCECFKLKMLEESRVRPNHLGPDREAAPRVVYICENWGRLHAQRNRLQEIEAPNEAQMRKDQIRAKSDTTKAAKEQLRQLGSRLTVEDLANNGFMMRRLAYSIGVKADGDPREIWERLFWKIAESQCERTTWDGGNRLDTWDLERVQKFVTDLQLQATPQPGPGDSQRTNWQDGWDDEDEGTWLLILAAPTPIDPDHIDLPRVLLRAIEATDDKTIRGALWRRYNQLTEQETDHA
jgi:ParB/RepB/Spo0J family partition protein